MNMFLFADDTTLTHSCNNFGTLVETTNYELCKVSDWFKANKLSVNATKTNYVFFGTKKIPDASLYQISLNGVVLARVDNIKFLGVYIDEKLTWYKHASFVSINVAKSCAIINRIKHIFPTNITLMLYYTLVYLYLNYCCVIWGSACETNLLVLNSLQRRVIRNIGRLDYTAPVADLFRQLKIMSIEQIYKFQVLSLVYRIKYQLVPRVCFRYITLNSGTIHSTRFLSEFKLFYYRTNIRKRSFVISGPELWNTLPVPLTNSPSLLIFMRLVKDWLFESC